MYKCLVWGMGKVFYQNINLLHFYEKSGKIKIIGITSNTTVLQSIDQWDYISKDDIDSNEFDIVVVMAERKISEIESEILSLGVAYERIILYRALLLPHLDLSEYIVLKRKNPSIFACNCWGGITYYRLGFRFSSPFINMFVDEEDYLRFLQKPKYYIEKEIMLDHMMYNSDLKIQYPVCKCEDIFLHFNHYASYDLAKDSWDRRKRRINWDYLFILFYTENKRMAELFDQLPYDKKICFVPFQTDIVSCHTLHFCNIREMREKSLFWIVSSMAWGVIPYYDPVRLLKEGKIVPISKAMRAFGKEDSSDE